MACLQPCSTSAHSESPTPAAVVAAQQEQPEPEAPPEPKPSSPPTEAAAAATSACRHPSRDLLGSRQLKHAWALLEDAKDVMGAIAAFTEGLAAAAASNSSDTEHSMLCGRASAQLEYADALAVSGASAEEVLSCRYAALEDAEQAVELDKLDCCKAAAALL